ncbi:SAM-dependent methyltransferase, partial [Pseudomonas syringae]|nr:SAM-dependent methyltransferase [Pseudomonas syringae]
MKSPSLSVKANRLNVNGMTAALLRKGVLRQLSQLRHGQLVIIEDGERQVFGAREAHLLGEIQILDAAVWGLV